MPNACTEWYYFWQFLSKIGSVRFGSVRFGLRIFRFGSVRFKLFKKSLGSVRFGLKKTRTDSITERDLSNGKNILNDKKSREFILLYIFNKEFI